MMSTTTAPPAEETYAPTWAALSDYHFPGDGTLRHDVQGCPWQRSIRDFLGDNVFAAIRDHQEVCAYARA